VPHRLHDPSTPAEGRPDSIAVAQHTMTHQFHVQLARRVGAPMARILTTAKRQVMMPIDFFARQF